jgi:hypothetical protein
MDEKRDRGVGKAMLKAPHESAAAPNPVTGVCYALPWKNRIVNKSTASKARCWAFMKD